VPALVLGAILVACSSVPWIFLAMLPLLLYFVKLRNYYLKTSREVKRLEAISRSPVLTTSQSPSTAWSSVTIRAFGRSAHFLDLCKQRVKENTRAYFTFIAVSRWLGFRLAKNFTLHIHNLHLFSYTLLALTHS
jgi:hypothetical protein